MVHWITLFLSILVLVVGHTSKAIPAGLNWIAIDSYEVQNRLEGAWRNPALGHVAVFQNGDVRVFHEYGDICIADNGVVPAFSLVSFDDAQDNILLQYYDFRDHQALLQNPLEYTRLNEIPQECLDQTSVQNAELIDVFDLVWALFDRHYAFFEQRQVDWEAQRRLFRPRATALQTDEALFDLLAKMLRPFNDGHVNLTWKERSFNAGRPDLRQRLAEAWAKTDQSVPENAFVGNWSRAVRASAIDLLDDGSYRAGGHGALQWGVIGNDVGYLRINRFNRFLEKSPSRHAELVALREALALMSEDLGETKRLILDVAHNGGGNDAAAMTVVEHFLDVPRDVLIYGVSGLPDRVVRLSPSGGVSPREIMLVTSEITASAAEAFVLMMRALPNVQHVGEATRGGISSLLPKPLPRGFRVTISYQEVRDADGDLFEGCGIPPTRQIALFPDGKLYDGYAEAISALAD